MKNYIITFFLLVSSHTFAQDSLDVQKIMTLNTKDTLIVDIKNVGCRVTIGDRYLILRQNSKYSVIQLIDFQTRHFLDGRVLSDNEKQDYFLDNATESNLKTGQTHTFIFGDF